MEDTAKLFPCNVGLPLPTSLGKSSLNRIIKVYSLLFEEKFGIEPMINFGMIGKLLKPLLTNFSEQQIACFLIMYFEFRGTDGQSEWLYQNNFSRNFPLNTFPKHVDGIRIYLSNVLGFDWKDDEIVRNKLKEELLPLMVK